jgi:hypothetical protein
VILSSHSLFVEGVATRLHQYLASSEIETIDAREADAIDRVIAARPGIVILETTDREPEPFESLSTLLSTLAPLTIIRLDREQKSIQVVTSKQQVIGQVSDLIDMIRATE